MARVLQAPGPFLALMLEKYKLNPSKLSKDIQLSQSAVRLITIGKTKITVPVAMRFAQYFNTNPEFWLAMQMKWDIAEASQDKALMKIIKNIPRVSKGTAGSAAEKPATTKKTAGKNPVATKTVEKKPATKEKAVAGKKIAVKKSATKKPVMRKKAVAAKKPVTAKKIVVKKTAAKKPVARKKAVAVKKPVATKKKVVVKARKTSTTRAKSTAGHVRRGHTASKR